ASLKSAQEAGSPAPALEEARSHFLVSGEAFAKASELTSVPAECVERAWLAAEGFAEGKDAARTVSAVKSVIELAPKLGIPLDPQRQGKAWFVLAEAYHELGQETLAQHAYGECISFRSSYAYRARNRQATALVGSGKIDEARGILEQNLRLLHE